MNPIIKQEHEHTINGVEGRMFAVTAREDEKPGCFCKQEWKSSRPIDDYGPGGRMTVNLRFDDECRNGHNTFAITAGVTTAASRRRHDIEAGGCMHDEIASVFPELAPFIPWHLTSSDAPMHYVANTIYHAGDRDCWGLRKGERQPLTTRSGLKMWELHAITGAPLGVGVKLSDTPTGLKYAGLETVPLFILKERHDGDDLPTTPVLKWVQSERIGEGKERQLDHARRTAIWPEATDADLMQEPDALRAALEARHPSLMKAFKRLIVGAGFLWENN